ncbi:MAG TPA: N-acetylmuramoyl-L-alanine amidase [Calditerricola sp.]
MDKGKRRVVIDPGHGGKDPGAVGLGLQEKEVVLHLAQHVRRELGAYEVDVLLTREADERVSLEERVRMANRVNADLFVSLHCNAGGGQGFESYVHPAAPERTRVIRDVLHFRVMAFLAPYGIRDRGRKEANFFVLRETKMPAVLLETLFLDHPREHALLRDEAFRKELAQAIAAGIAQAMALSRRELQPPGTGHTLPPEAPPSFSQPTEDVAEWAREAVEWVKAKGWMTGFPDGTFRPKQPVTREELAVVLYRILGRARDDQ